MTTDNFCDCFQTMFEAICADGREEFLFGKQNLNILMAAVKKAVLPCPVPFIYFETMLKGQPSLDILLGGGNKQLREQQYYTEEQRWQNMPFRNTFRFFTDNFTEDFSYGTTWDLSTSPEQLPQPGFYMDNINSDLIIRGTLETLNQKTRIPDVETCLERTPSGWNKYYLGLMPQRANTPIRLGWTIPQKLMETYRDKPNLLSKALQQLGYTDLDNDMLQGLFHESLSGMSVEIQLDLLADNSIGPCLGTSWFPYASITKKQDEELEPPKVRSFFHHLQEIGVADQRWERFKKCFFRKRCFSFNNGEFTRINFMYSPSNVKVKWYHRQPKQGKIYFQLIPFEY